jgi:hypothetical protein
VQGASLKKKKMATGLRGRAAGGGGLAEEEFRGGRAARRSQERRRPRAAVAGGPADGGSGGATGMWCGGGPCLLPHLRLTALLLLFFPLPFLSFRQRYRTC